MPQPRSSFWDKVDKTPGQGPRGKCWTWKGSRRPEGYGRYWRGGTSVPAAREAWERVRRKEFPSGHLACHSCDFPPCVRPSHIFAGMPVDNTADSIAKGRFKSVAPAKRKTHCHNGHPLKGDNVAIWGSGVKSKRYCRQCNIEKQSRKRGLTISGAARDLLTAIGDNPSPKIKAQVAALARALAR
jgi:hypothetical protein